MNYGTIAQIDNIDFDTIALMIAKTATEKATNNNELHIGYEDFSEDDLSRNPFDHEDEELGCDDEEDEFKHFYSSSAMLSELSYFLAYWEPGEFDFLEINDKRVDLDTAEKLFGLIKNGVLCSYVIRDLIEKGRENEITLDMFYEMIEEAKDHDYRRAREFLSYFEATKSMDDKSLAVFARKNLEDAGYLDSVAA